MRFERLRFELNVITAGTWTGWYSHSASRSWAIRLGNDQGRSARALLARSRPSFTQRKRTWKFLSLNHAIYTCVWKLHLRLMPCPALPNASISSDLKIQLSSWVKALLQQRHCLVCKCFWSNALAVIQLQHVWGRGHMLVFVYLFFPCLGVEQQSWDSGINAIKTKDLSTPPPSDAKR